MTYDDVALIWEKALQRVAALAGYDLRPQLSSAAPPIDMFGLAVRELMERQPDLFFLQIGAHDGLTGDPVSPYVHRYHWRGLLVEPQPHVFQTLRENYRDEKQLLFENSAIAQADGTLDLHCFKNADASDHASMLASSRKHYLRLNGDGHKGELQTITVPALTMNHLLDKHRVKQVDLLQIDTEGFDYEIIKMVDFQRIKPLIIHFENNFFNGRQRNECNRLLGAQGYAVLNLGIDTLAYLQPQDDHFIERMKTSKVVSV